MDSVERSQKLASEHALTFPLLSDAKLEAAQAFGVVDAANEISWPSIFLLDGEGRVVWRSLAQTYKVRASPEVILEAADALPSN